MSFQRHPLSAAFPDMPANDYASLVSDIDANGLREPGWVYEGMILDGWHRYRACEESGRPFTYAEYTGDDPVGLVKSRNLERRHLTASQKAAAVVACNEWAESGSNQHTGKGGGSPSAPPSATVAQMAKEAGVGHRTIKQAKQAHDAGLGGAVRDGALSVKAASEIAKGRDPAKKKTDPKDRHIAELESKVADLTDEMELVREGAQEAVIAAETAAALLDTEPAKVLAQYKGEIARLTRDRDEYMNKCGELVRQVKMLERKLARYERAAA